MATNAGQFQPGQSGNPGGRRKEKPYRDALRKTLAELIADEAPPPRTNLDAVIRAHVDKAKAGDVTAIAHIADRLDGKVPQALIGSDDPDDAPLTIQTIQLLPVEPAKPE